MNSLAVFCGLLLGSLNWFLLYKLYRRVFIEPQSFIGFKRKLLITSLFVLKTLLLFTVLYLVIVVFKLNVVYFLSGLIASLVGAVFLLYRTFKRSE